MINPSNLDLKSLPWLPLTEKSAFPKQAAIYFAIDSLGCVQYIGRSVNVRARWGSHHRYSQLDAIGGVKVAYLFVDMPELLPQIETALIAYFQPVLNIFKANCLTTTESSKTGMICRLKKFMDDKGLNIAQLSKEVEVTENAIRGYSKNSFSRIDCQVAIKLCSYFQVEVGEMFVIKEIVDD